MRCIDALARASRRTRRLCHTQPRARPEQQMMNEHCTFHVSDDPDDFVRIAVQARVLLGGQLGECAHGLDQSYWDLTVGDAVITIHREHYLGVMIICEDEPHHRALLDRYKAQRLTTNPSP